MTLNQLKYVIALSQVNSINEAAKKLFVSQPALTSALKALEEEVGFDIFLRTKNGISLTVKGRHQCQKDFPCVDAALYLRGKCLR